MLRVLVALPEHLKSIPSIQMRWFITAITLALRDLTLSGLLGTYYIHVAYTHTVTYNTHKQK